AATARSSCSSSARPPGCARSSASREQTRRAAMSDGVRRPDLDELDRLLSEEASGSPAGPPPEHLDPPMAAPVRRVHALDDAPNPDPAFTRRLWRDLMQTAALTPSPQLPAFPRIGANGHRGAPPGSPAAPRRLPPPRRLLAVHLATAILLL